MRTTVYSLRRRLLGWLLISTVVIGVIALMDTYREAVTTANVVSDRVLAGSALAIAERVVVAEDGSLEVDIPYVALEMLTSAAQDRVFYRVDGPPGQFITGYQTLPSLAEEPGASTTLRIRSSAANRSALPPFAARRQPASIPCPSWSRLPRRRSRADIWRRRSWCARRSASA